MTKKSFARLNPDAVAAAKIRVELEPKLKALAIDLLGAHKNGFIVNFNIGSINGDEPGAISITIQKNF